MNKDEVLLLTDEEVRAIKARMRVVMDNETEDAIFQRRTFRLTGVVDPQGKRDGLRARWSEAQETHPLPALDWTKRLPVTPLPEMARMDETARVESVACAAPAKRREPKYTALCALLVSVILVQLVVIIVMVLLSH